MQSQGIWKISSPKYESDELNPKLQFAYWEGHRDFAYDFVSEMKPKQIVELGSQYGCSLFAFCQSIKDHQLETEIHAIDKWAGDVGAPESGKQVYKSVQNIQRLMFPDVNLYLHAMLFDEAHTNFREHSIDLLHVDGGHSFEEVSHDFEMWLPNLNENGVVFFHDVFSPIDQGSCDYWSFIQEKYPIHFEFKHSCGLGILFPKGDYWYRKLVELKFFDYIYEVYQYRSMYRHTNLCLKQLEALYEERYQALEHQSQMIGERDKTIAAQSILIDERDEVIRMQSEMIADRDKAITSQATLVDERDEVLRVQREMIADRDKVIASQTVLVDERDKVIAVQNDMIKARDQAIASQTTLVDERDKTIAAQTEMIKMRDKTIDAQTKLIEARDEAIAAQTILVDERDALITVQEKKLLAHQEILDSQHKQIQVLKGTMKKLETELLFRNELIEQQAIVIDAYERQRKW